MLNFGGVRVRDTSFFKANWGLCWYDLAESKSHPDKSAQDVCWVFVLLAGELVLCVT